MTGPCVESYERIRVHTWIQVYVTCKLLFLLFDNEWQHRQVTAAGQQHEYRQICVCLGRWKVCFWQIFCLKDQGTEGHHSHPDVRSPKQNLFGYCSLISMYDLMNSYWQCATYIVMLHWAIVVNDMDLNLVAIENLFSNSPNFLLWPKAIDAECLAPWWSLFVLIKWCQYFIFGKELEMQGTGDTCDVPNTRLEMGCKHMPSMLAQAVSFEIVCFVWNRGIVLISVKPKGFQETTWS